MSSSRGSAGQPGGVLRILLIITSLAALLVPALPALAQDEPAATTAGVPEDDTTTVEVLDARVTTTPERARLIVDLSKKTEYAVVSLSDPDRIAIDVKADTLGIAAPADPAGQGIVSAFTVELAEPGRVRTTLALAMPAQVQQAYVLDPVADQPARLVVDLITDTPDHFAQSVAHDLAASPANQAQQAAQQAAADPQAAETAAAGAPPEPDGTKPLVVLDPGHGGIDNGATGPSGVHEKDITLAFALDLQKALIATGKFDVALTRTDDTYLTLNDRVNLARQNKADLFISLHADSFQQERDIHGASVYTRDENATDVLDKVLAENENKYDVLGGFVVPKETAPAAMDILLDLMRREMRKSSFIAAQSIITALGTNVTLRRFPVRQADFFVLQAPDVPSILIELGFLSNPDDVGNLTKPEWRAKVVTDLAAGIGQYFADAQQVAASQ